MTVPNSLCFRRFAALAWALSVLWIGSAARGSEAGPPASSARPATQRATRRPVAEATSLKAKDLANSEQPKPPPLHVDFVSYGAAIAADALVHAGATCRELASSKEPCIFGSGGGLVLRGGYRSPGPWYIGGAYQFSKTDSSNLYRLPILQQLRAEMRYVVDLGYRISPFGTWGLGGVVYGNEWRVETGGGSIFLGMGAEVQLSRVAAVGLAVNYSPMLIAPWTDTAGFDRDLGMVQYLRFELQLEVRTELSRR